MYFRLIQTMMLFQWEEQLENLSSKEITFTLLTWHQVLVESLITMLSNISTFWKMSSIQKCSKKLKTKTSLNSIKPLKNKQTVQKNTSAILQPKRRMKNSHNFQHLSKDSSEAVRPRFQFEIWEFHQPMFIIWTFLSIIPRREPQDLKMIKLFFRWCVWLSPISYMLQVFFYFIQGDLSDPHGTHRVCLEIIKRLYDNEQEKKLNDASYPSVFPPASNILLYRGAWEEWNVSMAKNIVPLSPK